MKFLFVILLLPLLVNAEPTTIQSLKAEPATMLDIGMLRIDAITSRLENQKAGMYWMDTGEMGRFTANYNSYFEPRDDKIYVSVFVMKSGLSESQMASGCKISMSYLRTALTKSLGWIFHHVGDKNSSRPTHDQLQELIELRCYFSSTKDSSIGLFWASWPLSDEDMAIGPWKLRN